jgi:aerobic-type carbon monoxide dehydrogenase small subunit (CoxS/CutS family)
MEPTVVSLTVNGRARRALAEPRTNLADFLRDELGLTGTHVGCEHGVCGACTVLLDGDAVRSCLVLAVQAAGRDVVTVEGLHSTAPDGSLVLHPLQEGFYDAISFQCGFCTPGFVMSVLASLRERDADGTPFPIDDDALDLEVREMISGNICRCTGYTSIVEGVKVAIAKGAGRAPLPHEAQTHGGDAR